MHITKIKVLSSIVGNQHIRECNLGTFEIDQHAYCATREGAIFNATDCFPIDCKGKRIAARKDTNSVDTTWTMTLAEFMAKYLRPDLRPGIDSGSFAIVILVEPVLPTIVVKDFKAVKSVDGLVAFSFLAVAKDHTKGIIGAGIIAFNLFHR
jgi:hypothetical protein